jgi:hypothetical protein
MICNKKISFKNTIGLYTLTNIVINLDQHDRLTQDLAFLRLELVQVEEK